MKTTLKTMFGRQTAWQTGFGSQRVAKNEIVTIRYNRTFWNYGFSSGEMWSIGANLGCATNSSLEK